MEAIKLRRAPLCLPIPEVKEVVMEFEEYSNHLESILIETSTHMDRGKQAASEDQKQADSELEQQIVVFENQDVAGTSFGVIPAMIMKTLAEMKEEVTWSENAWIYKFLCLI